MRGVSRVAMGVLGGAALLLAALWLARGALIESAARSALARQGFVDPKLKVARADLGRLRIVALSAGGGAEPDLRIESVDMTFALAEALRGRVRAVDLGPGRIIVRRDKSGAVSIAGFTLKPQTERRPWPFQSLKLRDVDVDVEWNGRLTTRVDGDFTTEAGGSFTLVGAARRMTIGGATASNVALSGAATLSRDGAAAIRGAMNGDVAVAGQGVVRGAVLSIDGKGASWRDVAAGGSAASGELRIALDSAAIAASEAPALSSLRSIAPFRSLKATGGVRVALSKGAVTATSPDGPLLSVVSDGGARLLVEAPAGADVFKMTAGRRSLNATATTSGAADGRFSLTADQSGRAPWRFVFDADVGRQTIGDLVLRRAAIAAQGTATPAFERFRADATVGAQVARAVIGRFVAEDAPLAGRVLVDVDLKGHVATVAAADRSCLALTRARLAVPAEATEARLVNARLCADGGPIVVSRWNGAPKTEIRGRLAATEAHYKVAATTLQGAPPDIAFVADYDPQAKTTRITGTIQGGRIAVNDALLASAASGVFSGGLDAAGMNAAVRLDAVTFSHSAKAPQFAPVKAKGKATLSRQIFAFDFTATTPGGRALGGGAGKHDVRTGRGEVAYRSGDLYFTPGGLQIAQILPAFRGVVGGATGGVSADVKAFWGAKPGDFASSAEFRLANLSFRGPGVAVSSTEGLDGVVRLSSLLPPKTEGAETIRLRKIDIGALKLENGVIEFALPGDETIRVVRADFPWYGGRIGAYDAVSPLTGAESSVKLRVDAVNLGQLLAGLKIEGLSGEGVVEGVLPVAVVNGRSFIRDGSMNAVGPGVVRYVGEAASAAASSNAQARLAFDLLRNLRFSKLGAKINGPLDGDLDFDLVFEGSNDVTLNNRQVTSPVVYRIRLQAPLLALLEQARVSTDYRLQLERAGVVPKAGVDN